MSRRRWLLAAAVLVVVVVVVVLALRSGGPAAERRAAIAQWDADLLDWEVQRLAEFGPDGARVPTAEPLGAVVLGLASAPVLAGEATAESLDAVNAACTAQASFPEVVRSVPAPPAAPPGLDTEHADADGVVARFDADRGALAAFVDATGADEAAVRQFCGTYPPLVSAHSDAAAGATGPAEANARIVDALSTQCYLSGWEPVCSADADGARDVAAAQISADPGAVDAAVEAADTGHAQAATAVGLGADRAATAAAMTAAVTAWQTDASAATTAFTDALGG
ncbi:hypothetical protein EXU48_05335 [Occultella glacieicola]|uniref:Uncharacterized protein n=1 Tax=Occultella glacieicola TaxID=2518684 RepID=A0ABY2E906_9MICO|nr:hypothetical protein [Occultella glacieicola]TDE97601.1 hypothetical protein EXU48_05335 [Occultella glacieicola]